MDNASGHGRAARDGRARSPRLPTAAEAPILFLAVTAEEKGLLGSQYYAAHPLYPLAKTLANINMDGSNVVGRTSDMVVIGLGASTLDDSPGRRRRSRAAR